MIALGFKSSIEADAILYNKYSSTSLETDPVELQKKSNDFLSRVLNML